MMKHSDCNAKKSLASYYSTSHLRLDKPVVSNGD